VSALKGFHSLLPSGEVEMSGFVSASNDAVTVWKLRPGGAAGSVVEALCSFPVADVLRKAARASALPLYEFRAAAHFVTSVSCDPLCKRMLLSFASGVVATVSTDSGGVQLLAEGHGDSVAALAAHPTFPGVVVTASADRAIRVWDVSSDVAVAADRLVGAFLLDREPTAAVFASATTLLVALAPASPGGTSSILEVDFKEASDASAGGFKYTLTHSKVISDIPSAIASLGVDASGEKVAAACLDGTVQVCPLDGSIVAAFDGVTTAPGSAVAGVDFSADGAALRTFGRNNADVNGKIQVCMQLLFSDRCFFVCLCFVFCVLCFVFCVLCFVFCVLCFVFCVCKVPNFLRPGIAAFRLATQPSKAGFAALRAG
jgi:WD40 repeat protein